MLLFEKLHEVLHILDQLEYRAALLGGLAVSIWTNPRFTSDIDLAIAVDSDERAEHLIYQLGHRGFHAYATVEQESTGRLATVRLLPPQQSEEEIVLDLLFSSSGIEPEIVRDAEYTELGSGKLVPVALPGYLIALKLLSRDPRRPQDEIDLHALRAILDDEECERARAACELIVLRGYHRGRPLRELLEQFLQGK